MSKSRRLVLAGSVCFTLWFFFNFSSFRIALPQLGGSASLPKPIAPPEPVIPPTSIIPPKDNFPPCKHLAQDNETLLVLRTGATEIAGRLPTHISTTLRCFPHYIIFSDYAETFLGERVLDALELIDPEIVAHNHDFDLYRRVKEHGRGVLAESELSGNDSFAPGGTGHEDVPGWKLDKWKFVPMLNRTFYEHPNMKWYVFIEGDSFVIQSTLQALLKSQDHTTPLYLGSATNIGDDRFAHGGTGFVVSRPAMQMLVDYYQLHKSDVETITEKSWAGDAVLGRIFSDAGVSITDVWPVLHGESTGQSLFGRPWSPGVPKEYEQVWCYPAASLHHMSPPAIDSMWHFEQKWLDQRVNNESLLHHKDIFKYHVMPQMTGFRTDWDNCNEYEMAGDVHSLDDCRTACEGNSTCRQYSYDLNGKCKTRINPVLGIPAKGVISGWLEDRIAEFERHMVPCEDEGFDTLPGEW